jgi:hypothetical protein
MEPGQGGISAGASRAVRFAGWERRRAGTVSLAQAEI